MTTNANNQLCAVCGGELQATTITHEEKRDSHIYLFQNVPAKVCTACGEIWIDEEVLQQIARLPERGVPKSADGLYRSAGSWKETVDGPPDAPGGPMCEISLMGRGSQRGG